MVSAELRRKVEFDRVCAIGESEPHHDVAEGPPDFGEIGLERHR